MRENTDQNNFESEYGHFLHSVSEVEGYIYQNFLYSYLVNNSYLMAYYIQAWQDGSLFWTYLVLQVMMTSPRLDHVTNITGFTQTFTSTTKTKFDWMED